MVKNMSFESGGANFKPYIPKIGQASFHSDGGGGNAGYSHIEHSEHKKFSANVDTYEHEAIELELPEEKTLWEKAFDLFVKIITYIILHSKKIKIW